MCKDCGRRKRNYKWIRNREGEPKKMATGGYVMQNEDGACFGFDVESLNQVRELLNEIEELESDS